MFLGKIKPSRKYNDLSKNNYLCYKPVKIYKQWD